MILETERLLIRRFVAEDLETLVPILQNEAFMRFSVKGPAKNRDEVEEYLNRILDIDKKHGFTLFAIVLKSIHKVIGLVGFMVHTIDGEDLEELGFRLMPEYWGNGLAFEAASALKKYGFSTLKMDRFISIIEPANERSIRLALRLGMVFWKTASFHNISVNIYVISCKYVFKEYDPNYPALFEHEKVRLKQLGVVEHIGSTAVPKLGGKGIIDIALGIDKLPIEDLEALGYEYRPNFSTPERALFKKLNVNKTGQIQVYHLHVMNVGSKEWNEVLSFRDYLIKNPQEAKKYEELKRSAADEAGGDGSKYRSLKECFFKLK